MMKAEQTKAEQAAAAKAAQEQQAAEQAAAVSNTAQRSLSPFPWLRPARERMALGWAASVLKGSVLSDGRCAVRRWRLRRRRVVPLKPRH